MMLFVTILIAVSFLAWYIADNVAFFLDNGSVVDEAYALIIEGSVRIFRISC